MSDKSLLLAGAFLAALLPAASVDTRLADAAMRGDRSEVQLLLKQRVDVNVAPADGTTALHWAAFKDDLEMSEWLLRAGANVKATTRNGALTPLFMACRNGDAAMIESLLKAGADVNGANSVGTTPLMAAASSGSAEAAKVLIDGGAKLNATESSHGQTALMFGAALNRAAVVKLLLARGADARVTTKVVKLERARVDADGNPLPMPGEKPAAASVKTEEKVAAPKKAGDVANLGPREVGATVMGGMTALLFAARDGQIDAVRELIAGGADLNEVSDGDKTSPIVMAIINGHYDVAKMLLDHDANPSLATSAGLTPLYATVDVEWAPHAWFPQPNTTQEKVTYLQLMQALLDHGANPNAQLEKKLWFRGLAQDPAWVDPAGATAFWRAAQSSDIDAMKLLIGGKADPKIASKSGDTPLMVAAGIGWMANHTANAPDSWMAAVTYCVESGADVNAVDSKGYTALHGAAYIGNNEMVKYLVAKGAKVDARSKAGDTVADMANGPTRFGLPHLDTVALLESLGSANSHNCRSDQCLVAPKEDKKAEPPKSDR